VIHKAIGVLADLASLVLLAWFFAMIYAATLPEEAIRWLERTL